jgi:tetratricopeptide (TPR) repeat protein
MKFGNQLRVLAFSLALGGCASHSDRTVAIRSALDAGEPAQALGHLNEALDVSSEKDLPASVSGDNSLLLLDRAMVLQELDKYPLSSRDLETADKQVDLLDLSRNAAHDIGKYLFSDDVGPYKAPAYEKLLINTENIVNYLARGDLNGARVEARRLSVMQKYLSQGSENRAQGLLGPGSYLAGFTFEKSGRADEALRYYDEALGDGSFPSLSEPVKRLMAQSSYSSPRLRSAAERVDTDPAADDGEILVIIGFGRVPSKIARRVPIGLALTYASGALSPTERDRANYLAAQGLVTWVNFPELGPSTVLYDSPKFSLDGRALALDKPIAIDEEARNAWKDAQGAVVASAITRMIARVAAGETVRRTTKDGLVGAILSLGVQATLTATDTPDTRSWQTLPARLTFGRIRVKPGVHEVEVFARGARKRQRVTIAPGGFAVVAHTVLR